MQKPFDLNKSRTGLTKSISGISAGRDPGLDNPLVTTL